MNIYSCYFYFLLFFFYNAFADEYVYPVASFSNEEIILYIHQIGQNDIQLYSWNLSNNTHTQMVWSLYNPTMVQLLPSNTGFSFIDNGRLRIKLLNKRTPRTIDFDEPIFNINTLHWLNDNTYYCSAYYNNHFSLLEGNDEGEINYLIANNNKDCMYPQKSAHQLFYIERYKNNNDNNYNYTIMQTNYNDPVNQEPIVLFHDKPIIFLNMVSETEGFVIEHEKSIDSLSLTAHFIYHHIIKQKGTWIHRPLFSFKIPTNLFLYNNDQRLFESILPLLPKIIHGKIYFVDCTHNKDKNLESYYYDLSKMKSFKTAINKQKGHIFVPTQAGSKLCFGGTKNENNPLLLVF